MQRNAMSSNADVALMSRYQQNQQRIESKLITDITHLRTQLAQIAPHSRDEADVWSLRVYQAVLNRRMRLLQTLFPQAAREAGLA